MKTILRLATALVLFPFASLTVASSDKLEFTSAADPEEFAERAYEEVVFFRGAEMTTPYVPEGPAFPDPQLTYESLYEMVKEEGVCGTTPFRACDVRLLARIIITSGQNTPEDSSDDNILFRYVIAGKNRIEGVMQCSVDKDDCKAFKLVDGAWQKLAAGAPQTRHEKFCAGLWDARNTKLFTEQRVPGPRNRANGPATTT